MKIWHGYGSEHSSNLVMIGHFESAGDALKAREVIQALVDQVRSEQDAGALEVGEPPEQYSDSMLDTLARLKMPHVNLNELEQFTYEVNVELEGNDLVITTDEYDISAFLKVLVDEGARVEVYSAHRLPGTGHGR